MEVEVFDVGGTVVKSKAQARDVALVVMGGLVFMSGPGAALLGLWWLWCALLMFWGTCMVLLGSAGD